RPRRARQGLPRARRGDGGHQRRRHPGAAPAGRARLVNLSHPATAFGAQPPSRSRPVASGSPLATIGVLALQGDVREHLRALVACGADARPVRRPEELDAVDGLIIPGGESTTIGKLVAEFGLADPIRKRLAGGMPAYGSCAGMIMLAAEVLDGRPDQLFF